MPELNKKTVASKDGSTIYYETYAGMDEMPVLFLVHGIGGDTDGWQYVRDLLRKKGYPVVAVDLRGHGHSDHPKHSAAYAIERVEEDVLAVFEAEHLHKPVLIGHSGGAIVAAHFASTYPEKISSLVLIAGSYCPPAWLSSPLLQKIANGVISIGALISPPPYKRWHSPYPAGKVHKEFEFYGLMRTMFYNSLRSYLHTSGMLINVDLRGKLEKISAPTLLIAGEKDGIFPVAISQEMQKKIPDSALVVLAGTNHVSILNNPVGVTEALLEFLRF